ncbi:MAG: MFS transporter [Burkholderiales bacterium]|nr:MFS transporter [Burkholderiales bacterium]
MTLAAETAMAIPVQTRAAPPEKPAAGTPAFWRTARGMFVGGFGTFVMLYSLQPLMPQFSDAFGVSPAAASGVVSAATGCLALGLLPASVLADRFGRKPVMVIALAVAALLTVLSAFAGSFQQLLVLRGLVGLALAGLPATGMAYLSEEMERASLGRVMGLYVGGNALGGMSGRLITALLIDHFSWRVAVGVTGVLGLVAAVEFWRSLPASRHFKPASVKFADIWHDARTHFADGGLPLLFATSFVLMGCFVSLYNYLGYRLAAAPFNLTSSQLGMVFSLYIVGIWASAQAGRLADRMGRRNVLWLMLGVMLLGLALTLANRLAVVILGLTLCTVGFFGGHAVASSWVGMRAQRAKALASAIYLCSYYLGSSLLGSLSGLAWQSKGWLGVAGLLAVALILGMAGALKLRRLQPLPVQP